MLRARYNLIQTLGHSREHSVALATLSGVHNAYTCGHNEQSVTIFYVIVQCRKEELLSTLHVRSVMLTL